MPTKSRKRVTRSGKGAFSLYLPKKWVDNWSEDQYKDRKVDLLELDDHLIISPVRKNTTKSLSLDAGTDDEIRQYLLCTYVRGYESADLESKRFADDQMSAARSFMRLLDEKMILDISEDRIAFGRSFKVSLESPTISQMQRLLFEKIQESLRLARELLEHFDKNPTRAIYLLKMMRTLEEEDVDRMSMQIFRRASRMELKFDSFADLFFVVLTTDMLEKLGDSIFGIARSVCRFYGMDEELLLFPLEVIEKDLIVENFSTNQAFEDMRGFFISNLEECEIHLRTIMDYTLEKKGVESYQIINELEEFNRSLIEKLNVIAQDAFISSERRIRIALLQMMEIRHYIIAIGELIEELAKEIAMLYFCEKA
jgi:hypothetical protein